ncbi:hypothetical protein EX30DRAFT_373647 [Ascodesmis nigricans]|uniref:GPI inositol-deacylase winged helix domain-containing protein n=1 Tax=Ascodesmis nigricans TaxID=341454 RepID=A0A4S2MNE9_9PEZI|nr:hypothetical protein EX30DRAFT_373647 [Ascodesmis nigricans]
MRLGYDFRCGLVLVLVLWLRATWQLKHCDWRVIRILVDGINNVHDSRILDLLAELHERGVRFFVTSRPENVGNVRAVFGREAVVEVDVTPAREVVREYLLGMVGERKEKENEKALWEGVLDRIIEETGDSFLLVRFALEEIRRGIEGKIDEEVVQILKDRETATMITMKTNLTRDEMLNALKALSWVAYDECPLTFSELRALLPVEVEGKEIKQNLITAKKVMELCKGFVEVNDDGGNMSRVRLVHSSVREYLDINQTILDELDAEYRAKAGIEVETKDSLVGRTPLSWDSERGNSIVVELLLNHGVDVNAFLSCFWIMAQMCKLMTMVLIALQLLLARDASTVDEEDNVGRTPLLVACRVANQKVVEKLAKRPNVDIKRIDKGGRSPAQTAVEFEVGLEYGIVKVLREEERKRGRERNLRGLWTVVDRGLGERRGGGSDG